MSKKKHFLNQLLERETYRLYQESAVNRFLGWLYDDSVKVLLGRPLGMFFYNLRAIFLGGGLLYLIVFWVLLLFFSHSPQMIETAWVLLGFWLIDTVITVSWHPSFVKKLNALAKSPIPGEFPPLFDRYFILDCCAVVLLILVGRYLGLGLDLFACLLFANALVYSAYVPGARKVNPVIITLSFLVAVTVLALLFLLFGVQFIVTGPHWFAIMIDVGPVLAMSLLTVLSVSMIPWLRSIEHDLTFEMLKLTGEFENILSEPIIKPPSGKTDLHRGKLIEQQFGKQIDRVLKRLCSLGSSSWYHSACLWFVENHMDRGLVLLPMYHFNFNEAKSCKEGINVSDLAGLTQLKLFHSLKDQAEDNNSALRDFRKGVEAPAAFVPLYRGERQIGVLALYGSEQGPPLQRQEEAFLKSVGSIISNTMEQWEGRYHAFPQREMDDLFKCETLAEVFTKTAKIMQEYLVAAGCMVIFRPESDKNEMNIIARVGFTKDLLKTNQYAVGQGQTGVCAATGRTLRFDDVALHRDEFDADLLEGMEAAHKKPITSWMAIPIGPHKTNRGVIKVVNRASRFSWFRDEDAELGLSLALRLHVIIEKFQFIEQTIVAKQDAEAGRTEAQLQSEKANREQKKAEQTAMQRQDDLMIITHQLQGPLDSLIGTISYLQTKPALKSLKELAMLEALVEDGIALCYGTFTTFALGANQKASFDADYIDAPAEMAKLCERLQRTNKRDDLTFSHSKADGFPTFLMDRDVFTSVLYSLIHNAMKYSDKHSEVELECSFERDTGEAALKVRSKGEPILMFEADRIFEKFERGQIQKKTGRHHSGVGLGLWVARELMRAVNGDLTVHLSPSHPRLSVFVMHLPDSKHQSNVS
ncbi:MAG TPA: GAF domain-containing sensor histidine kinase [Pyrinomonadaceae bacterium]|jgi:signal transduction histidine kinase|nr:GAF domain-containing sensor histidine kinase [Pyrinomonadaceae bacterium]